MPGGKRDKAGVHGYKRLAVPLTKSLVSGGKRPARIFLGVRAQRRVVPAASVPAWGPPARKDRYHVHHRDSVRIPRTQGADPHGPARRARSSQEAGPGMPVAPAMGLRLPATAPPDEPLRPTAARVLRRGAGLRAGGRRAPHAVDHAPRASSSAVPHLPEGDLRRRPSGRSREAPRPAAARLERLRALVLHADGARVHAAPGAGRRSSTTAWTSCRRSAGRRRSLVEREAELLRVADVVFTGGHSLLRGEAARSTRTSTRSRAASTSATSARRARLLGEPADQARDRAARASASSA